MKIKNLLPFTLLVISLILSSCVSTGGGGASKLVDTFYKGKGKILFFVNSFTLKGSQGNPDITWDFTYDFEKDSIRPVVVNFSVYDKKFLTGPYAASINGTPVDSLRLLFADLQGRRHRTRFSGNLNIEDFRKIALSDQVHLNMQYDRDSFSVRNSGKWSRKARHIRTEMLDVIRLTDFQR